MTFKPTTILRFFNFWPPFFASGISVREYDLDEGFVVTRLKRSKWNENAFGTQYGGSLFSMCDPFYVFLLAHKLGKGYYIWDLESNIKYLKATRDPVTARFELSNSQVENIKSQAASGEKVTPEFHVNIVDAQGNVIAEVKKTLYVKLKKKK